MISTPEQFLLALESATVHSCFSAADVKKFAAGDLAARILNPCATALKQMSARYVALSAEPLSVEEVRAYALYYLPVNAVKIWHLSQYLKTTTAHNPVRMLDYGSGPLTATTALCSRIESIKSVTAVDTNAHMLQLGKTIFRHFAPHSQVQLNTAEKLPRDGVYDLIVVSNVLTEISADQTTLLLSELLSRLALNGKLMIVEPGMREPTRTLMSTRNQLLKSNPELSILYPCTHTKPCPLLARHNDWCHAELTWSPTRLVRQLDALTGFNKHRLKFSCMIFSKEVVCPTGFRVITPPVRTKIASTAYLCGASFAGEATLPRRNRCEENRLLDKTKMHSRITISPGVTLPQISRTDTVTIDE